MRNRVYTRCDVRPRIQQKIRGHASGRAWRNPRALHAAVRVGAYLPQYTRRRVLPRVSRIRGCTCCRVSSRRYAPARAAAYGAAHALTRVAAYLAVDTRRHVQPRVRSYAPARVAAYTPSRRSAYAANRAAAYNCIRILKCDRVSNIIILARLCCWVSPRAWHRPCRVRPLPPLRRRCLRQIASRDLAGRRRRSGLMCGRSLWASRSRRSC